MEEQNNDIKKVCFHCKKEKTLNWYYKLSKTRLRPECKICTSKMNKKRYIESLYMKKIIIIFTLITFLTSFKTNQDGSILNSEWLYNEILEQEIEFPDIAFAQAMIESGNLTSKLCKKNNNLFGMRLPVRRETTANGQKYGYAKYDYWQLSVADYYLYQEKILSKKNYTRKEYLNHINKTYSHTKGYSTLVNNKIKEFSKILYPPPPDRNDGKLNKIESHPL